MEEAITLVKRNAVHVVMVRAKKQEVILGLKRNKFLLLEFFQKFLKTKLSKPFGK